MDRILVAEDESACAELIRIALGHSSLDVLVVGTGHAVLQEYGKALRDCKPITLMILDCALPGISGEMVAARVRELGDFQTRIIYLTGNAESLDVDALKRLEIFDIWPKPEGLINLEEKMSKALRSREQLAPSPETKSDDSATPQKAQ